MTEWRDIETRLKDVVYEVSSCGLVRKNGVLCRQHLSDKGYPKVTVAGKSQAVHRLVALAFVENPHNCPEVNHIDGDKRNSNASNLEWCTRSQNMKHAYAIGLHPGVAVCGKDHTNFGRRGRLHHHSMPVRATFPDGSFVDYESQGEAERAGFLGPKISACIHGKRKTHGGATWMPLPPPPRNRLTPKVNRDDV